jgi:hypothetical protein
MFNIIPPLLIVIGLTGLIILLETIKNKSENKNSGKDIDVINLDKNFCKVKIVDKVVILKDKIGQFNQKFLKGLLRLGEKLIIRLRIVILRIDHTLYTILYSLRKHKEESPKEKTNLFNLINIKNEIDKTIKSPRLNIQREKKILKEINKLEERLLKNEEDINSLLNLVRLNLFLEDYSSARYYLIKAFKVDNKNIIVHDLMISIFEKDKESEKKQKDDK